MRRGNRWLVAASLIACLFGHAKASSADRVEADPSKGESEAQAELKNLPNLPGHHRRTVSSPDSRFLLRAVPASSHWREYRYRLVLEELTTKKRLNLMPISRNVDIGWSDDSSMFFVNDNYGSNVSDCVIFRAFDLHKLASIAEVASKDRQIIGEGEQDILTSHLYFSCVRWLGSDQVLAIAYGHYDEPDPPPFEIRHFAYSLTTGIAERIR